MSETNTGVKCVVCEGRIVEKTNERYLGDPRDRGLGPGGKSQTTEVKTLYCSSCELLYHKLPKRVR